MNNTRPKQIYIEAWRTSVPSCPWCAETSSVNPTLWRPKDGTYGLYDFDQWPTWYKLIGNQTTVIFVSNHEFSKAEAIAVSAAVLAGKVRRYLINLDGDGIEWI